MKEPGARKRDVPLCKKCGRYHWHFLTCDTASIRAFEEAQHRIKESRDLSIRWQPDDEWRPFGDRFETLTPLGGGTLMLRREGDG